MIGDANRTQVALGVESTYGTSPVTFTALRVTSESLAFNIQNITSNEIRSDRQVTDLIQTGADVSGGINFELSYGAFDSLFEGALGSTWVGVGGTSVELITSATAATRNITANSTNKTLLFGSSIVIDIKKGQWIKLYRSGDSNNGYKLVTNVAGQTVTVDSLAAGATYNGTTTLKVYGGRLRNGATDKYFSIERAVDKPTGTDYFFLFSGLMVNTMAITASASAIVTGSFDFIGKAAASAATSKDAGGLAGYDAAAANNVMNAVANVGSVMEGANSGLTALNGVYFQEISFNVNNNLRGRQAIGVLGNVSVGVGRCDVTGSVNAYFETNALYKKYIGATETGLSFKVEDVAVAGAGNAYIFTFPRVKFSSDAIAVEGVNTDIMERLAFTAIRDAAWDYQIQICRFVPQS